eukprot:COSAG02_NODE_39131_length_420_cov_1.794393_1_plen_20_part_01
MMVVVTALLSVLRTSCEMRA